MRVMQGERFVQDDDGGKKYETTKNILAVKKCDVDNDRLVFSLLSLPHHASQISHVCHTPSITSQVIIRGEYVSVCVSFHDMS